MALTPATGLADYASGISTAALQVNSDTGQVSIGTDSPTTARLRVGTAITMSVGVITATDAVFRGNVSIAGTLTYEDVTSIDSVGILTARAGVRIPAGGLTVAGVSSFSSALDVNAELDVDGQTDLDNLVVAGVSTFSSSIDLNGELDVDGQTDLDTLQVAGVSTFSAAIDLNAELDVDGQTDLDTLQVAGVSTFAADVSIADKIVHDGDTNTAIRFPADDTITAETSGTERVRITGLGSFGVGNDDPAYRVSVKDTKADGTGVQMHLWNNSTNNVAGNVWTGIRFTGSTADYETAEIKAWRVHPQTSVNSLSINTGGVERMVLSSSGVGIGTVNPQRDLHIHNSDSSTNSYLQITSATTGTASADGFQLWAYGSGSSKNAAIVQREDADIEIWTNNTERLRIESGGDVGIGLTNPEVKLHVQDSAASKAYFSHPTSNRTTLYIESDDTSARVGSTYLSGGSAFKPLDFLTSGQTRLRIDSNGNMGLGTTTPNNYNNYSTFTLNNTTGGEIDFEVGGTLIADIFANAGGLFFNTRVDDDAIVFSTHNGSSLGERLRIKDDGVIQFTPAGATSSANASFDTSGDNFRINTKKDGSDGIGLIFEAQASGGSMAERLRINSVGGVNIGGGSCIAAEATSGDFSIDISGLRQVVGSVWRQASILVYYVGLDGGASNSNVFLSSIRLRGLSTWNTVATTDISGSAVVALSNDSQTGCTLSFDVADGNSGSVIAVLNGGSGASTFTSSLVING